MMVMEIKKGMLLKTNLFNLAVNDNYQNACREFLIWQYRNDSPEELILNAIKNNGINEKQLFPNNKTPVNITVPDQGIKMDLLMLCKNNYEYRIKKAQV